jgi:hypothetical protein
VEPIIFFSGPDSKTCTKQSSFAVTLIAEYSIKLNYCGVLSYHKLPLAISIQAKLVLQEQVKYYQHQHNHKSNCILLCCEGSICKDEGYAINIIPLPLVDAPGNVITCNSYTPNLTYGDYYTGSNGGGLNLDILFLHLQQFMF